MTHGLMPPVILRAKRGGRTLCRGDEPTPMPSAPFTIENEISGFVALLVLIATIILAVRRRPAVPRATLALAGAGAILLGLAAAGLAWLRPVTRPIAVMVDLSPSTRGAAYRDPAALDRRVRELLGTTPFAFVFFSNGAGVADRTASSLPDLPSAHSALPPTDAPAVLLFSDGRLSVPSSLPPVFCVVDSALENANDAAVSSLVTQGNTISVGVRNSGASARMLSLPGAENEQLHPIQPGSFTLTQKIAPGAESVSATLAPGDKWPENDSLRTVVLPPFVAERWWVGGNAPNGGWRSLPPDRLPNDVMGYLGPAVVVLNTVAADSLDPSRQSALRQYVSDLGGGLVILGGDRAFAAGSYAGTSLDTISPLASTPPEPATHWLLVADASGSMNQDAGGGRSRWQYAADAVVDLLQTLPPADLLSVGSFASDLRWWTQNRSVSEKRTLSLPPADVRPGGATNLDATLRSIAMNVDGNLPTQLLLATDARATIADPAALSAQFKTKNARVHVLLIGDKTEATGLPELQSIVTATGGSLRSEALPEQWAAGLRALTRAAQPNGVRRDAAKVKFVDELASLGTFEAAAWNRTWPKAQATPLAEAAVANERVTMAARWNVGEGRVAAAAFAPSGEQAEALAKNVERPPRDPRFKVTWDFGSELRVVVDAADQSTYLNHERFTLQRRETNGSDAVEHPIPQTGPGRYALTIPAIGATTFVTLRRGKEVIDRVAGAGRYAAEFDAVGNDRVSLAGLARRTNGAVIEPGATRKLDLPWPRRPVSLVSWLATAGAALIAAGLVRWRIGS